MLHKVEVREIEVGVMSPAEIKLITKWFWEMRAKDELIFPTKVVSMDNEDLSI